MKVVTRFAPSPTGMLHIGSARTALFNYYFAKRYGGTYFLRIEDTDRERSTPEAVDAIINGFKWLGVPWDGEIVFQMQRQSRHVEIAEELVKRGQAYYCYMTAEEIAEERAKAEGEGKIWHYDRRWRDRNAKDAPPGVKPAIRIKAPMGDGAITLTDQVQGEITIKYQQLDDMVMLRADGTPTYMLAVVVDDYDMGVTHVIRGDDHLNNMFRQYLIYQGMGWDFPIHAHVPMIHGDDGKKLSKRRGAASVEEYRDMGYLPEAMRNYLLRLGWSHGDEEIITHAQATEWFDLAHIGKSPAQWDFAKLNYINHHYIKLRPDNELYDLLQPILENKFGSMTEVHKTRILSAMPGLKERSKTLVEMADTAEIYIRRKEMDTTAQEKLAQPHAAQVIEAALALCVISSETRNPDEISHSVRNDSPEWHGKAFLEALIAKTGLKMGQIGPVLRATLTGTMQSPDLTEVITALGAEEVKKRLEST